MIYVVWKYKFDTQNSHGITRANQGQVKDISNYGNKWG